MLLTLRRDRNEPMIDLEATPSLSRPQRCSGRWRKRRWVMTSTATIHPFALERRTAELLGKEDAVYMVSGTMTNQVALRAHTESGDEVLADVAAHIAVLERGAPAALSGITCGAWRAERDIHGGGRAPRAARAARLPAGDATAGQALVPGKRTT